MPNVLNIINQSMSTCVAVTLVNIANFSTDHRGLKNPGQRIGADLGHFQDKAFMTLSGVTEVTN